MEIAAVATTNGAPITSYQIEIDNGMGGSFTLLQDSLSLSATKSLGIYSGLSYRVRYRAKNALGYSDYSDISYILAARKPDSPLPPTVTIQGTQARIQFSLPFNGGSEITKAYITIRQHDGVTYTADTTNCDGTISTVFQARVCLIPLTFLRAAPWSLVQGDYIIGRVQYENEIGLSDISSDTASPPQMPYPPHAPLSGPQRVTALTSDTTMTVYFSPLTALETGGSPILSYFLEMDSTGSGSGPFTEIGGLTSDSL